MSQAVLTLLGDVRDAKQKIDSIDGRLSTFGGNLRRLALGAGLAIGTQQLISFGRATYDTAIQMETWNTKATAVFGENLGQMQAWADGAAHALGLTQAEAVNAAAGIADVLKPLGATADEAARMAQETTYMSGVMSEWDAQGRSSAEWADILTKAYVGQRDALISAGVAIQQSEVDQRALEIAHRAGRDEITQLDQALATHQLITEKTTDAQAAFEASTNDAGRRAAEMNAQFREIYQEMSAKLLPIIQTTMNWISLKAIPAMQEAAAAVRRWWDDNENLRTMLGAVAAVIRDQLIARVEAFLTTMRGLLTFMTGVFQGDWGKAWEGVKTTFEGVWQALKTQMIDLPVALGKLALDAGKAIASKLLEGIGNLAGKIKDKITGGLSGLVGGLFSANIASGESETGGPLVLFGSGGPGNGDAPSAGSQYNLQITTTAPVDAEAVMGAMYRLELMSA